MQLIEKEILIQVPTCPLFEITPQLRLIINKLYVEKIRIVALNAEIKKNLFLIC